MRTALFKAEGPESETGDAFGIGKTGARAFQHSSDLGEYIADVLLDTRFNARVCHWIVQKVGSSQIVVWGQEYTFDAAIAAAQSCLENLNRQQKQA